MVGYNRDETVFFFNQQRNTEVFNLTEAALKERLAKEFAGNADAIYEAYHKSRPEASPSELYVAITTARMIGIGSMTIAERKYAQHGAPAYMYIFKHANESLIPGTQFKMGSPHAMEITYKFYNVRPPAQQGGQGVQPPANAGADLMGISGPSSVKAAHNMAEMWSTFARTGKPGATGQPQWPAYNAETLGATGPVTHRLFKVRLRGLRWPALQPGTTESCRYFARDPAGAPVPFDWLAPRPRRSRNGD
jgi:para-nitrobenzyl esterase